MKEKTLAQWKTNIRNQIPFVDIKPYSHNIISISLSAISKKWGKKEANKAVVDLKLEDLGWKQE